MKIVVAKDHITAKNYQYSNPELRAPGIAPGLQDAVVSFTAANQLKGLDPASTEIFLINRSEIDNDVLTEVDLLQSAGAAVHEV